VSPDSLQKSAEALNARRTADSNDRLHARREIPRRDHHQVPLRNAREASQSRSSRLADVADVSEGAFGEFAAKPAELLASFTLRAFVCCVDHTLLFRVLMDPATLLRRSTLGDVGPHAEVGSERDDPRRAIALVGDDRFDLVVGPACSAFTAASIAASMIVAVSGAVPV
jgi:hypothetical protein